MINAIDSERELQLAYASKNSSRNTQIDKDATYILQKSRKKVQGKCIGIQNQNKSEM